MSNKQETKVFTFNENNKPIRVEVVNGEPWFVAKDVCDALTLENSRKATASLDDDEKGVSPIVTPSGTQQMTTVNESGLYALIFQSRKPEAKKFRKWVTSEVLPSIRKTGSYSLPGARRSVVRMSRGEGARTELLDLLWLIGESLEQGDQAAIALELGVSRVAVNRTLNGLNRSSRILMALYKKAKENREKNLLYNNPGEMAAQLREAGRSAVAGVPQVVERVSPLPEVRIMTNKRGGQYGNQNARKSGRKEGK